MALPYRAGSAGLSLWSAAVIGDLILIGFGVILVAAVFRGLVRQRNKNEGEGDK